MNNMKYIALILVTSLFSFLSPSENNIKGKWNTGVENTIIEIYKTSNGFQGKVISTDKTEIKKNQVVLRNITQKGGVWKGEFYIPTFGMWLDTKLQPRPKEMEVTVYTWLMSKTKTWKRL